LPRISGSRQKILRHTVNEIAGDAIPHRMNTAWKCAGNVNANLKPDDAVRRNLFA
jgi:hypothetical protein